MGKFAEVYRSFSKGEWGTLGAYAAGRQADGFFTGQNVIVYADGSLGPRPGLKKRTYTSMPNGSVDVFGFEQEYLASPQELFFVIGTSVYAAPAFVDGAVRTIGTLSGGAAVERTAARTAQYGEMMWFVVPGSGVYRWDRTADTLSLTLADPGVFHDLLIHRDRMYACGGGPNRVYYSDAADYNTFDALSYFDIPSGGAVLRMATIRNNLHFYIEKGEWMLSGVPESTATLRRISPSMFGHSRYGQVDIPEENRTYLIPSDRNAPLVSVAGIEDRDSLAHLETWAGSPSATARGGTYLPESRDVLFLDGSGNGLLRHHDVWTRQEFSVGSSARAFAILPGLIGIIVDGDASNPPEFYVFQASFSSGQVHRPGFVSDTHAQPGDDSTTPLDAWFHLPEWWHPRGYEAKVMAVEVEFTTWNTGTTETAHFDLVVEAKQPRLLNGASAGGVASQTYSFDEAVASSSTSGTDRRVRFNVGDAGWGRGFQVQFTNIRSAAIQAVTVIVEDEPRAER